MKMALIHIPHSSTHIPPKHRSLFFLREKALQEEILRMTDLYTDDLFADCGTCVVFPVSRLICDVERFRDPDKESMTARGMWVCYERTADLQPLKRVTPAHRQEVLTAFYDPHHARLTVLTEQALRRNGQVLLVDAHSFSSVQLPYETVGGARPDICIGTDDYHTPAALANVCTERFSALGYTVAVNRPFSGCLIPMPYYRRDKRVTGIMIEVNRRLYMDESTGKKTTAYGAVKRDLTAVIQQMTGMDTLKWR